MKWRKFIACLMLGFVLTVSTAARADDLDNVHDARTEGYRTPVQIEGSTALLWIGFGFGSIVCMAVLFKDAGRGKSG